MCECLGGGGKVAWGSIFSLVADVYYTQQRIHTAQFVRVTDIIKQLQICIYTFVRNAFWSFCMVLHIISSCLFVHTFTCLALNERVHI